MIVKRYVSWAGLYLLRWDVFVVCGDYSDDVLGSICCMRMFVVYEDCSDVVDVMVGR